MQKLNDILNQHLVLLIQQLQMVVVYWFIVLLEYLGMYVQYNESVYSIILIRSVTITCAYLIKKRRMTALDALRLVHHKRSVANPNPGFLLQLLSFQTRLGIKSKKLILKKNKSEPPIRSTSSHTLLQSTSTSTSKRCKRSASFAVHNIIPSQQHEQDIISNSDLQNESKIINLQLKPPQVKTLPTPEKRGVNVRNNSVPDK